LKDKNKLDLKAEKSVLYREIDLNLKSLFKSLGKSITHVITNKQEELGDDIVEAIESVGLKTPDGELAHTLIKVSLLDALFSLTKESVSHLDLFQFQNDSLINDVVNVLESTSVSIDDNFFRHPARLPFLSVLVNEYVAWLISVGVSRPSATVIANRLPSYFVFCISKEWRKNSSKYAPLELEDKSPFKYAENSLNGWNFYFSYLRMRVSENIFDEPFSLSQIYIPLNAYYIDQNSLKESSGHKFEAVKSRVCVNLAEELKSWIGAGDKSDALRVISGGPGSGKSSFTKMFCCELAESGLAKPIYIPLHVIDPTRDVVSEVERFVRDEGLIGFNPMDSEKKENDILLVFDGLDELASMGKIAAQVARDFVQAVERMIERRNLGEFPIRVLISGRELIVQENETEFRRNKQILNILPYVILHERNFYEDPNGNILSADLRSQWWINYGNLIGENFSGIPNQLKNNEIDEITSQPLLNYLVALSYRRGKITFSESINLNSVYADLLAAVHERAYENSRTYRPIKHLNIQQFKRVLEEIGVAAWHGNDGRSTSVRDIMQHCNQSGLDSLLKSFTEGAEAGVIKLLAAFFFRRNGENVGDDATFVFTHKSFGEYLTSVRLVGGLSRLVSERQRRKDSIDDGWDISDALVYWLRLAGPASMTEYLQRFLGREIEQLQRPQIESMHEIVSELLEYVIDKKMPVEKAGSHTFFNAHRYDVNASTSLMIALNFCAKSLKKVININFSTPTSFGTFFRRICPQRTGPQSPILYSALSYFNYSRQSIDLIDLYGADISNSIFEECQINLVNFGRVNLNNCYFSGSQLVSCVFIFTNMHSVIFEECSVESGDFSSAHLINVSFKNSNLSSSRFESAMVQGSSFNRSNLFKCKINKSTSFKSCTVDFARLGKGDRQVIKFFRDLELLGEISGNFIVERDEDLERHV